MDLAPQKGFQLPTNQVNRPNIFEYLDYRSFLVDTLGYLKLKRISARAIAKRGGFASPNYLILIAQGKRNLSSKSVLNAAYALRLNKQEILYFDKLVQLALARDVQDKDRIFRELVLLKGLKSKRDLDLSEYSFYRDWRMVVVYEAVPTKWASFDRKQICAKLGLQLDELDTYFEHMKRLNLIEVEGSKIRKKFQTLEAPQSIFHEDLRRFHRSVAQQSLEAIDKVPMDQRHLGCVTMALSPEQFQLLKRRIEEFKKEINLTFPEDSGRDKVYQINVQVTPALDELSKLFKL